MLHKAIGNIHDFKRTQVFKASAKSFVILLMILGAWVATRDLDVLIGFAYEDKFKHIFIFFSFSLLMDLSTLRKPFWLWKASPLILYGFLIEILQYFSPDRAFSLWDWVADISGILLYLLVKIFIFKAVNYKINK